MAGKHKQKRRLRDQSIATTNIVSDNNINQKSSDTNRHINNLQKSKHSPKLRSRSPVASTSKKTRTKLKSKSDNSDTFPNSSSIDSDTGSHISKRRRRETRSSVNQQISEPLSTSSNLIESTKSRRRRSVLPDLDEIKLSTPDNNMASSSSQRSNTDNASHSATEQSKICLPSTSRGKRNNSSTGKNKSKITQFNISSPHDGSLFLSGDTNFQGVVSSGVDISHFQNYLSSRSLTSTEIGDQINKKLEELRSASNDRTQEYMLMSEINQHLLVSYEDSLNSLRVGELVSQVVGLIQNCEDNLVDLKNICYNVLLHLMEALPRSSDYLVSSLTMFLNKITNLFDFDSLEQIINVIERVSRRHGQAVLQCGAFTIILNYYDFLTAPQQLTILNMISQCFNNLKPTDFNYVIDGIENLSNRLKQSEPKCVDKVIQCFVRLVNAFQGDESKLKKLASNNLFSNIQELLISSPPVISDIHEIIQMLAVLCANCPDLAVDLIKQNITQTILCVCNSVSGDIVTNNVSNTRSVEEILSLVNLISELMPPLPLNDDLFIINRLISNQSLSKISRNGSCNEHAWYWYNAAAKQWISHPQNVCQLLEKTLNASEFEVSCQSNGFNVDVNLITMEQTHQFNGSVVISDLKRSRHQVKQSQKNSDNRVDSRKQLLLEQCHLFENSEICENLEAIDLMRHLFPLLIDIYNEASSHQVRYKCMEAMIRMIYPTTNKALNNVLNKASLSSLMASLLTSQDSTILINSIQMGTIIKKLPSTLILNFKKEGVLYQLDKMLSNWKGKMCDLSVSRNASTSLLSTDSNISMTVSAPPGSLDQLSTEHSTDYTNIANLHNPDRHQHIHSDIIKLDQSMDRFADVSQMSMAGGSTNTTQRFTNWIMKRSGCIGRSTPNDANPQSNVKSRKHRIELEQALDMSVKNTSEQVNPPASVSTNKRINQIMSMLNLNSSLTNVYHPYDNKTDKISYDNPKRELFCKQWILKFGNKLDSDWRQIGDDSVNEKISSISASVGPKKDIIYYLKEIASGLRTDNVFSIKKALTLYAELLATECYISVFEMESSFINEAMLEFFTNASSVESKRDHFLIFIDIFNNNYSSHKGKASSSKKPLTSLVNHLLMCLHQQEQFHVRMSQLPATPTSNIDSSSSRHALQSRYTLTQVLTDAVLGRISSSRRLGNSSSAIQRNVDPSSFESRLLPNLLLDSSFPRPGSKVTEVHCHISPYFQEIHPTDVENGFEFWNGGELIGFNTSFNITLDVLGTISSIEKIVMREISRHRRINKRFGIVSKELSSINDSSDSDDDYDCDAMNESLLSGEIDYQDDVSDFAEINFTGNTVKKHESVSDKLNSFNLFHMSSSSHSASKSVGKKSRNKSSNILKTVPSTSSKSSSTNPLSKIRESGLKALTNKRTTRQSQNDSESLAITPSTSSGCSSSMATSVSQGTCSKSLDIHSKYPPEVLMKPISKMQILIGDVILPPDMTLYQAIRRYSNHVTQFMTNFRDGKTDQEMEEAINQIIWKSPHNINYRPVSSIHHHDHYYQGFRSTNHDSVSTLNFMASLLNSHSRKFSHFTTEHSNQRVDPITSLAPNSNVNSIQIPLVQMNSINTRQRTFHRKMTTPSVNIVDIDQSTSSQPLRHKRRRKNNCDSIPTIGRSAVNSHNILFSNLTQNLPYPTLIDFPTIFEPIPISKIQKFDDACDRETSIIPRKLHHDLNSNMSDKLETTLSLLRCLYFINRNWHVLNFSLNSNTLISEMEFRSQKLSSKANRQLQDTFYVLARNIPFWCVQLFHTCAFLFSLETRQNFLYLFNFDRARTLLYLEGAANQDSDTLFDSSSSDIRRIRVQVNRSDRLLEESELLLKNHTDPRILLEISFNNEAGFGLGPTNEFYTQVSKCLMKTDLLLWYSSAESNDTYVMPPPAGLYPRPIYNKNKKLDNKIRNKFVFVGRFMARALLDCRKIDLPLNPVFYKWLLGQEDTINSADIFHIDPNLASQLKSLHDIVNKHLKINNDKSANKKDSCEELNVEELQIVFVHPIYTNIELVKDGTNRVVTLEDLSLYLDLIASFTLIDGVRSQMECVIEGFDSLLPGARMHLAALFEAHEMEEIFCGGKVEDNQAWDVKTLTECCVCDHGYTMNSKSIVNLFEIMSEFTKEQRRYFVQFCTGTPRLPVGGFRALKPPFKIVNKKEGGENPDNYLPSVMTCQNFLKLPDYSSKEVMHDRMLYALHEGQNAFFLS